MSVQPVSPQVLGSMLEHPTDTKAYPKDLASFPQKFYNMMISQLKNQIKQDDKQNAQANQNFKESIYGNY